MNLRKNNKILSCYFCHSLNVRLFLYASSKYSLYKCKSCSVVFTFPQLEPSSIKATNNKKYDSLEEKNSRLAVFKKEYQRAKKHIFSLKKYKESGDYLDIGCSYGITVKVAQDFGFNAHGIEPTAKGAMYAKEKLRLNVQHATLEKARLGEQSFDIISLYDVLEHIPNIENFLEKIRVHLKPKGLLVIQSPNIESYAFKMLKRDWNWLLLPNHLWHFSCSSLKKILEKKGFKVLAFKTEDDVHDFSSNFISKIFINQNTSSFSIKILKKVIYLSCYFYIFLCTIFWSKIKKGGSIQVYAIKK